MHTKSQLAIQLSKLKEFHNPDHKKEQYSTPSEIAATVLWYAYMQGDIENKKILDLGAGTGILGIGALLLNAKKVTFIEEDEKVIELLKKNLSLTKKTEIIRQDVTAVNKTADTIIMNPPFGTKQKHADKKFLEKAFALSPTIYSFHKTSTITFLQKLAQQHNFTTKIIWQGKFPLRRTHKQHKRTLHYIDVTCVEYTKKK